MARRNRRGGFAERTWMAPPGWYMLFVVTPSGVPSRGAFVFLS
ncbi:MAG: DUF1929 domain-containing protein [Planctomycetes bacterium]|nr:DUF1929 domain-containing protein [Planctomycetota bacterium]